MIAMPVSQMATFLRKRLLALILMQTSFQSGPVLLLLLFLETTLPSQAINDRGRPADASGTQLGAASEILGHLLAIPLLASGV
jgi:hypothetical protein